MSKLLIVSDSSRFRAWARLVIEGEGYAVLEARDGLAALQYAIEARPTMILVDPDLATAHATRGGLSASDVQSRLMREPQTEAIPVVVTFAAIARCCARAGRAGASERAMRRSTATLSLRETICSVLDSQPPEKVDASTAR